MKYVNIVNYLRILHELLLCIVSPEHPT